MKTILSMVLCAFIISFTSCADKPTTTPVNNNPSDTTQNEEPTATELLLKKWLVSEAYVDGSTPDNSSKGLKIEFKLDGSYTLFLKNGNTNVGTWAFIENETKIDIDEGSQFHQTWTITEFNEETLDVDFKSPFTGQDAQWIMTVIP